MENDSLKMLAQVVLPSQILEYFAVVGVEQTPKEIRISLDERMNEELSSDVHFESKGFMEAVSVTDFPITIRSFSRYAADVGLTPVPARVSAFR